MVTTKHAQDVVPGDLMIGFFAPPQGSRVYRVTRRERIARGRSRERYEVVRIETEDGKSVELGPYVDVWLRG